MVWFLSQKLVFIIGAEDGYVYKESEVVLGWSAQAHFQQVWESLLSYGYGGTWDGLMVDFCNFFPNLLSEGMALIFLILKQ